MQSHQSRGNKWWNQNESDFLKLFFFEKSVDEVDYPTATEIFAAIEKKNNESASLLALPYKLAIFTATGAGFASFPLCFNLDIAKWFNTHYVTTDVPGVEDLETMLEVGAWTWNWMEPPLGQISFFLLCLQFSRAQIQNLGIQPYTERVKSMRASELSSAFPKYDKNIIKAFSESNGIDKQRWSNIRRYAILKGSSTYE